MSQRREELQKSQIEVQIRRVAIEREEYLQRSNHLMMLLIQIVKQYGGEDNVLMLSKAQLDKIDATIEGVNLRVGDRIVRLSYTTRIRESVPEQEIVEKCECGGNDSPEATHTDDCAWWKQHKAKPRSQDSPADHKLCPVHRILTPPGVPCSKCMNEAAAQVLCECGRPKYRHVSGYGACKDADSDCQAFRPKIEAQA